MNLITDSAQELIAETSQSEGVRKTKGRVTFVNAPIKVFGIVFNHAFPLDISITKYCFQGCPFCFATANKRANGDVIGNAKDATELVFKAIDKANGPGYDPTNFIEYCIHRKYPIIFSNNVDPFMPASEEQFKIGERVLEKCLEEKQPLFIQTKEVYYGERVKELLIKGKDLFQVYVSLSTLDYDMAKQYETVAVTPAQRLERIKELTSAGVHVVIAANPYVQEWIPDMNAYAKAVKDCGASGVFAYPLHLSAKQKTVMPKRFAPFINKADRYDDFHADMLLMEEACKKNGVRLYYPRQKHNEGYYKGSSLYQMPQKVWPIDAHWFVDYAHEVFEDEKEPVLLTWEDCDKFYSQFPEWNHVIRVNTIESILAWDSEMHKQVKALLGAKNKIKNIVRYIWNNPESQDHFLQFHTEVLRYASGDGKEVEEILDENGDRMYIYDPSYKGDRYFWDENDKENAGKTLVELA